MQKIKPARACLQKLRGLLPVACQAVAAGVWYFYLAVVVLPRGIAPTRGANAKSPLVLLAQPHDGTRSAFSIIAELLFQRKCSICSLGGKSML